MRDLQWRVERSEPQRHDELMVADLFRGLRGYGDFVTYTLLLDTMRGRHEQHLRGLRANRVFEDALPVIATAQAQRVGKYLVAKRGQLRAKPQSESVILRTGVADEQRLARRVAH